MTIGHFIDLVLGQTAVLEARGWFDELKKRYGNRWQAFRILEASQGHLETIGYGVSCLLSEKIKSGGCDGLETRAHALLQEICEKAKAAGIEGARLERIDQICKIMEVAKNA